MATRLPPQNLDAERSVLGAILVDTESISRVGDMLKPEHFYAPQHGIIYEAIMQLYHASKPIDVVTLKSVLEKMKKLSQVGGVAYLSELIAVVPTSAHIEEYASLVKECSVRRRLISYAATLDEQARVEDKKLDELLDTVEGEIFSVSQDNTQKMFKHAKELLEQMWEKIEDYAKNPGAIRGIPTGWKGLDEVLGGFHNSDLVILAARPSVGKTSFALDVARRACINHGKAVAFFSLEMPEIQVIERVFSQQIDVPVFELRTGKYTDEVWRRYTEGVGKLSESNLYVVDTPALNIMQLRSMARKLKMEANLDMIIIDYLQLMQGSTNRVENRTGEVSEISRSLKILARELGIPVIALSQLNRAVENRTDRKPQLSDLRESGSIEQDADVVIFLSREKLFNAETANPDVANVIIAKHRNGPIGEVALRFVEKTTKFEDMD
jgi:replicative DNA helicase